MAANQPEWPHCWLMTDERIGDRLWEAVDRLPGGGGIVFRHYGLGDARRLKLGAALADRARELRLLLAVAGSQLLAERLGAALVHNPDGPGQLPFSMAVHEARDALAARDSGAALVFVAPIYPTRSHPGAASLGTERAVDLARLAECPAIALGGMDAKRFAQLDTVHPDAFHGYAGIDCWLK